MDRVAAIKSVDKAVLDYTPDDSSMQIKWDMWEREAHSTITNWLAINT